jgi:triosephosphate isomerase (TIM)
MNNLFVANWKMNLTIAEGEKLLSRLKANIKKVDGKVVICPDFVSLSSISNIVKSYADQGMSVGAQNLNPNDFGAFTGEVSAKMLSGLVDYCIVGHSERRIVFSENDELISKKVAACFRNKIIPILCVGENIKERHEGLAKRTIIDQLDEDLSEITPEEVKNIIIAYEPVWAIGTGQNATPGEAEEIFLEIQKYLLNKYSEAIAPKVRLLYGGSVNSDNSKSFLSIPSCEGLLVGGASLNYKEFSKICQF